MPETNAANPLPESNSSVTTPNLSLSLVPDPDPESSPRARSEFNRAVEAELTRAAEICAVARKPAVLGRIDHVRP